MMCSVLALLHGAVAALVLYMAAAVWVDCGKACGAAKVQPAPYKVERPRHAK